MSDGIENARIDGINLGYEDHDVLTLWVGLDFGGGMHQGYGGYVLDGPYDKQTKTRKPALIAGETVVYMLKVFGCENWGKLNGLPARAWRDPRVSTIGAIGHFLEDRWFYYDGEHACMGRLEDAKAVLGNVLDGDGHGAGRPAARR